MVGIRSNVVVDFQLPSNTTWQTLRDQFGEVGDIKFAEMRGKDVGIIRFSSDNEASRAVGILFYTVVVYFDSKVGTIKFNFELYALKCVSK